MSHMNRRSILQAGLATAPVLLAAPLFAQEKKDGQPLNITVTTASSAPDVSIVLGKREGHVTPCRKGCQHTGGGNIDVKQPSANVIVATMTGVAVAHGSPASAATASLDFTLVQSFEVSIDNPKVKGAKLIMEATVIGFLRSHKVGCADQSGSASISPAAGSGLTIEVPSHSVGGGQSLGVNDKEGPVSIVALGGGKYCLTQTFRVSASMPKVLLPCKSPSAEFADGALDPLWISAKEPFKGAKKGDLGFQVTITAVPE